ncbi:MAG TPA: hypothetical protein IAC44_02120 [Candidatus Merdimorpha stercoravium]|uniref:DUF4398 domain-containing protein n=1 Tax=Candidatus Merdimorpha stercoravium TaxID=2840863 RepID=A0A9D1H8I2_9FLAO|nr:hypothetical protein [Candidatus Merdimorpha stercoravium]
MKRYAILLILSLGLCLGLGAQNPPAKGTPTEKDQGRELRENLRKATEAFMAAPDSKEAENNFVEAQKAVFAYQKKLEAQRKARAKKNGSEAFLQAEARLKAANDRLEEAKKAFEQQVSSASARDAFVKAQKAVFEAQKAMKPLILVDGKECKDLSGLDKRNMKSFTVIKNPEDLKPYGDKGKNGVVLIATYGDSPGKTTLEQMRMRYLSRAIGLKDKQKETFEKIYNSYTEQAETLRKENKTLAEKDTWQDALEQILKNNIAIEQKRYEMFRSLKSILSDEQLAKLYRADLRFAREMMARSNTPTPPADPSAGNKQPEGSQNPGKAPVGAKKGAPAPPAEKK